MTVLRSLAYQDLDDLLLVVHRVGDLDDEDWPLLVDATKSLCARTDKCLVLPGGARLKSAQSMQIGQVVKLGRMRVAVLLEGRAARGAVAALGWLTKRYRGFAPDEITEALVYLRIAEERYDVIFQTLNELGQSMARQDIRARTRSTANAVRNFEAQ